jgi:hypothetical protein
VKIIFESAQMDSVTPAAASAWLSKRSGDLTLERASGAAAARRQRRAAKPAHDPPHPVRLDDHAGHQRIGKASGESTLLARTADIAG